MDTSLPEQKRTAEEDARRLRALLEAMQDVVIVIGVDGRYLEVVPTRPDLLYRPPQAIVGRTPHDIFPRDQADRFQRALEHTLQTRQVVTIEYRLPIVGQEMWFDARLSPIVDAAGEVTSVLLVARDMTARKRDEEQMARHGRYLACLADTAQLLLSALDPWSVLPQILCQLGETAGADRTYLFVNRRDEQERLLTSQALEWCAPGIEPQIDNPDLQDIPLVEAGYGRWVETMGQNRPIIGRVADFPDDEKALLEAQGIFTLLILPLFVAGSWYGFVGFDVCRSERAWEEAEIDFLATAANDIAQAIERQQALASLQESEERYRRLIDLMPDGVAIHQDGKVVMVNQAGARILGYDSPEEVVGLLMIQFVHPDDRPKVLERVRQQIEKGKVVPPLEERFLHRDGSVVLVESAAAPFTLGGRPAALVVVRSIGERRRLEEQLRQAQKMEAVGQLAGGIAHDFNNLLTAINGYADLLLHTLNKEDPLCYEAEAILKAGRRAAQLTQQLLAFSRKQVMAIQVINLRDLLEDVAGMLRRIIGDDIELQVLTAPDLGNVRVDPSQIEQVIVNLVLNARDAMPDGGALTLELDNIELDANYVQEHAEVLPGPYVRLSVSDSGEGIPPDIYERIFEPFFTTKETGTGLGLATAYGIVKQLEGHIQVYSEPGRGTTFKVYLPRALEPVAPREKSLPAGEWPRGSETVLVVEDNEMVRNLAVRVLAEQGYAVLGGAHAQEALLLSQGHRGPIHLLLTDVVMPQISGRALLERLRQERPEIAVLYMSGYTDNVIARHGILEPGTPFLQKPFSPQALAQKVRAVLDAQRS